MHFVGGICKNPCSVRYDEHYMFTHNKYISIVR
jgi:hypothetical protein